MNEMSTAPGHTYTYDNAGNMISDNNGTTITTYSYDYENRLTTVTTGGTVTAVYTYNALGQRIGFEDSGTQTWTVYDGPSFMANPYADFNGSGTLLVRYLFGPIVVNGAVMTGVLARTSSGGTTAWYLADKLGSVRDIVDTSGTELDHIVYDSFGNIVTETNASNGDRFKFAGMQYDTTTQQYFDHARWYGSVTGRFSGQDPTGFRGGDANLYRYTFNLPTQMTDPSGEISGAGFMGGLGGTLGAAGMFIVTAGAMGAVTLTAPITLPVALGVGGVAAIGGYMGYMNTSDGANIFSSYTDGLMTGMTVGFAAGQALAFLQYMVATCGFALAGAAYYDKLATTFRTRGSGQGGAQVLPGGSGDALAGHGGRYQGSGTTIVPQGAAITLPRDGVGISDKVGGYMESNDWEALAKLAMRDPDVAAEIQGMATYLPGAEIPNYILHPPDKEIAFFENSFTTENPTALAQLLQEGVGYKVWAACTWFFNKPFQPKP